MSGLTLRKLRTEKNLRQVDLAKLLGVCSTTVIQWEGGHQKITRLAEIAIRSVLKDVTK